MQKTVLVLGATGRQGGATAYQLLKKGWKVRALIRDLNKPAVQALKQAGVDIIQGDYDNEESLDNAMQGAYGVFSMQASVDEVRQGKAIADAAVVTRIQHFVYSSMQSADDIGRAGGDANKWEIEQYIYTLGLPATILRPPFFMETLSVGPLYGIPNNVFAIPIRPDVTIGLISVEDIGAFAALAFEHPDEYLGKMIEIAGDILTPPQIASTISRVTGRPIHYAQTPIEAVYQQNPQIAHAIEWLNKAVYSANLSTLRNQHPDLMNFETWLKERGKALFVNNA
jgi:uncharacterized protein YbjT (DUF2867 family)